MSNEIGEAATISFEEFFEAEYDRIMRAMYLASGQRDLAEELTQEAMARAYERWDRIRQLDSPAGYVMKMAFNLRHSWFRRATRVLVSARPDQRSASSPADLRYEIEDMLGSLPTEQREALVLVEWLGLSSEEAGSVLGISSASVRGRIHRARTALRSRLGEEDD